MTTAWRFLRHTLAPIGSSVLAGSLVSCLVVDRFEPLHIALMVAGAVLTTLGHPLARRSPRTLCAGWQAKLAAGEPAAAGKDTAPSREGLPRRRPRRLFSDATSPGRGHDSKAKPTP